LAKSRAFSPAAWPLTLRLKLSTRKLTRSPELERMRDRESDITKERINKILAIGANVILTTGDIHDLCLKYFVEAGAIAVRRCLRQDLKRIAKATGASFVTSLANIEGEESFEASLLDEAEEVSQVRISDDDLILMKGTKARTAASIILRGPSDMYTDEMERSILMLSASLSESWSLESVVVGGGCVEAALSIYLENFATSLSSREQLAIAEFAKSLLVIPKTLSVNAVKGSAKFRAYQNSSQTKKEHEQRKNFGLDLYEGVVRDNKKADVFEPGLNHDPQDCRHDEDRSSEGRGEVLPAHSYPKCC